MRKILWIVLLFISANIFAQNKNEFFVKNSGDTVYCQIKKLYFLDVKKKEIDKKNSIEYIDGNSSKNISFDSITGYKKSDEVFRYKKIVSFLTREIAYNKPKMYYFFPNNDGRYFKKRNTYVMNNNNVRFYDFPDNSNTQYISTPHGGYNSTPPVLYAEKDNDGKIYQIMDTPWGEENERLGWSQLKAFCNDNAQIETLLNQYYEQDKKCNLKNLTKVIEQYTGKKFDDLPEIYSN